MFTETLSAHFRCKVEHAQWWLLIEYCHRQRVLLLLSASVVINNCPLEIQTGLWNNGGASVPFSTGRQISFSHWVSQCISVPRVEFCALDNRKSSVGEHLLPLFGISSRIYRKAAVLFDCRLGVATAWQTGHQVCRVRFIVLIAHHCLL